MADPGQVPRSPFTTVLNFRDVAATAPLLNPKRFFRSARPDEATPEDQHTLASSYGIRTIVDLRSHTEHMKRAENRGAGGSGEKGLEALQDSGIKYVGIDMNGSAFIRALLWRLSWASLFRLLALMALGYRTEAIGIFGREVMAPRGLVGLAQDTLDYSKDEIKQIFHILSEESNYPILVHCTQGKDRTGLIVILTLLLLDVPIDAISADYTASEVELEVERKDRLEEMKSIGLGEEFASCPKSFVQEIRDYLSQKYGGIEDYLAGCNVAIETMGRIKAIMIVNQ